MIISRKNLSVFANFDSSGFATVQNRVLKKREVKIMATKLSGSENGSAMGGAPAPQRPGMGGPPGMGGAPQRGWALIDFVEEKHAAWADAVVEELARPGEGHEILCPPRRRHLEVEHAERSREVAIRRGLFIL